MARELKPQKVEEIYHRGTKVDLMLDRNSLTFFAKYNDEYYRFSEANTVKEAVVKAINEAENLVWKPVIRVNYMRSNPHHKEASISLGIHRFYYAVRPDGKMVESEWEFTAFGGGVDTKVNRNDRAKKFYWSERARPFVPPVNDAQIHGFAYDDDRAHFHFLPYTEELWQGLISIENTIIALRQKLDEIITTPEGQETIAIVGANLLAGLLTEPKSEEVNHAQLLVK